MQEMICCGFGHRDLAHNYETELLSAVEKLINCGINTFYVGNNGDFDKQFTSCIIRVKKVYSNIKLYLVLPYITVEINKDKAYYEERYDGIIVPEAVSCVHYKSAFTKRNKWMVEKSQVVLACVYKDYSGAYEAIKYAHRLNKTVINIAKK